MFVYISKVKRDVLKKIYPTPLFIIEFFKREFNIDINNKSSIHLYEDIAQELLERCILVSSDHTKATKLLPVLQATGDVYVKEIAYTERYFKDIKETITFLKDIIPVFKTLSKNEYIELSIQL